MASSVSSCSEHKLNGITLLHAIVRENPPLDIVTSIIKLCPEMLAAKDGLGRTPLHIAAGSRACPLLLKLIACAYPAACDIQDEGGRTPLHFVCDTSFVLFANDGLPPSTPQQQKGPKYEAVVALLSESLNAAAIEDSGEMSPLEHAIMCDASLKTVKLLQASARKSMQSRARSMSTNSSGQTKEDEYQAHLMISPIALQSISIGSAMIVCGDERAPKYVCLLSVQLQSSTSSDQTTVECLKAHMMNPMLS
eukprot:CAMPEP_0201729404 /NCGR_PEP_ID=MMETSP0593-20130828/18987_1 /ASSEMBLY_ACC=CAM_ASM_000672 /TAXON_ID=267983 /ORGANISM="Skeletonema japonicum, Strain CCMP2506" /LENGTH=250 /DNA_ID=CAMNT_0048221743 /DNA_START=182 /DNA_END=935 /DNA_ORIENTATION=+